MRKWALYILLITLQLNCSKNISFAQTIFYQDICQCGVTGAGFSTGLGLGTGSFDIHIEPASTIKKAFLFTYSMVNPDYNVPIILNNDSIYFNPADVIMNVQHKNSYASPVKLYYKDITNLINPTTQQYSVQIQQSGSHINEGLWTVYLYVVYQNPALFETSTTIVINNQNLFGSDYYGISSLNLMNKNNPIGFAIYTDRVVTNPLSDIYFNNIYLGAIGGSDNNSSEWYASGVKGHFYYQNNQLFGLDDDTPDAIMDSTDGLADVSSYFNANSTSCSFSIESQYYPNQPGISTSANLTYFLSYTSPCGEFPVTISTDTTICQGEQIQLHASGGTKYEWKCITDTANLGNSTYGLSCNTCANPIFSGDSSAVYTVRVWNGDSCSVVHPVRVTVNPKPKGTFSTIQTACGENKGVIKMQSNPALYTFYTITENGDTLQSNYQNIPQVGAGNYTAFFVDTNGCKSNDSLVTVGSFSNVTANFTVTPAHGSAPLSVVISNISQNAQNYQWLVNGDSVNTIPTYFDTSGTYQIQLVAWNNIPECSDTITKTVLVYDSLILEIPNVFTPNNDGINDNFTVKVEGAKELKWSILNRWGEIIYESQKEITEHKTSIILWNGKSDGNEILNGTYFYLIEAKDEQNETKKLNGFFHLTR